MSALFISYARKDAQDFAKRLYDDLTKAGYAVWQDIHNLDDSRPFDAGIEKAIRAALALIVFITPDVAREDSFVRREIMFALDVGTRIIPLKCVGGTMPITINLMTWIDFREYDTGCKLLLERLQRPDAPIPAVTRRDREKLYLQKVAVDFERWLYLYTDLSGKVEKDKPQIGVKPHALKYMNTQNAVYRERGFIEAGETTPTETVNELREVVRQGGVVLIGDPGSGKTTTLQRLAYEFAEAAMHDENAPLPVFVPLGAYNGGGLENHISAYFDVGVPVGRYLPKRVVLLLDGLNEMPRHFVPDVDTWLRAHPDVLTVVTCRRLDYAALSALPLRRVDVSPLDVARIRLFMGSVLEDEYRDRLFWALAGEKMTELWGCFRRAELDFDDFWHGVEITDQHPAYKFTGTPANDAAYNAMRAALRERGELPGLLGLVTNPFLLNITLNVFIPTVQPPRNRGQLFGAFVDLLIEERGKPAASALHPWIAPEIQIQALAALAYRMQAEKKGTSVSVEWAKAALNKDGLTPDSDNLLYLAESATLLTLDSTNREIKFFHQLLQEYFAALRLGKLIAAGTAQAADYWRDGDWWTPTGWEEAAVLLAGMQPGMADWLLPTHPILACRAVTEGLKDETAVSRVTEALVSALNGGAPPIARAEVGRILNRLGDPRPGIGVIVLFAFPPLNRGKFTTPEKGSGVRGQGVRALPDIAWCDVPAGDFLYGDDKTPTPLDYDYQISKYPITNAQFQPFIDDPDGYANPEWWTEAGLAWRDERRAPDEYPDPIFRLPNHPRIYMRWYEAFAYCNWLTAQRNPDAWRAARAVLHGDRTSYVSLQQIPGLIRLPTEHEWEKAARGTDGRVYPWGDTFDPLKCNSSVGDNPIGSTSAVGMFEDGRSPYEAYDMSGNVWEWCLTAYETGDNDPNRTYVLRVLRGGSWSDLGGDNLRSAVRSGYVPGFDYSSFGFRCARS